MPETTVVAPAAVVPADRLTLAATDARDVEPRVAPSSPMGYPCWHCMAEE